VFNVNIGLSNLQYLGLQEKMAKLLVEKKKLDAQRKNTKLSKAQQHTLKDKIDKKQSEAKQILADLKKLKERRQAQCVYSYI
jgi:ribosomal protein S13